VCHVFIAAKEALKRKIERVIRREFSVEIRKKEEEIELINQARYFDRQVALFIVL